MLKRPSVLSSVCPDQRPMVFVVQSMIYMKYRTKPHKPGRFMLKFPHKDQRKRSINHRPSEAISPQPLDQIG